MFYDQGLADAACGSLMQIRHMDVTANNLANVSTTGFKGDRLIFDDMLSREMQVDFSQGSLQETGNPLDVALSGDGFFMIRTPGGDRLTRSGAFKMDANGALVTSEGHAVLDSAGQPVTLNPSGGQVFIDSEGNVSQDGAQVATLAVVEVQNKAALQKDGRTAFSGADGQLPPTAPAADVVVNQGSLEMSNVTVVDQMVNMITAQRAFESYQKAVHSLQEIDQKAVSQVGKV
ncbi:flagellar basal-body rod protein FlgF [Desulfarculus baarsii DSM 2075]|uniref:Flagellar basal-body rod protein FlgF n=1 Tax=Desulfarculus baarsii (strain ATCC 33931 / DSM 2075 / LMG 7858 / VKM B-1802 / 2st14) TaxID=644282 RepID=E1QJE8_DESB2|nr:flagellar basal-body rod protein FlgF [Desulfarculus baarsii]ADK85691.1 flagellar basal-body rod protein FlgF [Desulfarculus baarsii DSM 2075]